MNVLDLFSGIGGFSLGLERAGMKTVAFCEIKPYCQKVLKQHWPDVPIFEDVRNLTAKRLEEDGITVGVVCGGFPCQDLSATGKKAGPAGARSGLYREMLRIISECRPRYAVFENVTNLLVGESGRWFAQFLYDLAAIGFDAEWHCIPASAIGANHHRDRIWIVAYPQGNSIQGSIFEGIQRDIFLKGKLRRNSWGPVPGTYWEAPQPGIIEVDDGLSGWVGSVSAYGNAVVPQIPEIIGRVIMTAEGF